MVGLPLTPTTWCQHGIGLTVIRVRRLTEDEYEATMGLASRQVTPDERPPFDFWTYFHAIPREDWEGHDFSAGSVSFAFVMPGGPVAARPRGLT